MNILKNAKLIMTILVKISLKAQFHEKVDVMAKPLIESRVL
jgi:hypothetical protein